MRSHVDWLTFTMSMIYPEGEENEYAAGIERAFMDSFPQNLVHAVFGGKWTTRQKARAPYADSWQIEDRGIVLFASPSLSHCCVEISGEGCERILGMGKMEAVIDCVKERVTRIDIACDIETNVAPSEFVPLVKHERMRASGYQRSETGETCYVGSQKSDRYARVYRYNPPHPRAHLLRVEHVFRRDYAKLVAAQIGRDGVASVAKGAGEAFGWAHPAWQPGVQDAAKLSLVSEERKANNTVFWLVNQVAPAFRRLVASGDIKDAEAFLVKYFLSD